MRLVYNTLFVVFFLLSAPFYFLKMWRRGNWQAGFGQRFGFYTAQVRNALGKRPTLWLHAVSVGEVGICVQLIRALEPQMPECQIVVSTTTSTGMAELQRQLPSHIEKIYYPVDFFWGVERALNLIRPRALILIEAEIWPNLLWRALDRKIPLFLVNARVSERSFRGYRRARFLFGPIFARFSGVGCQNEGDAGRLKELGFPAHQVRVTGNLKFDAAKPKDRGGLDVSALLGELGVGEHAPVLVAGSTHNGEEAVLADIYLRLRQRFPELFLVLVPRHFERAREVGAELQKRGLQFKYRREITEQSLGRPDCLLVNTTGELKYFYQRATVVFVGKSLTAEGGQNPIEPGALGKAMVFGPNMQNFVPIVEAFLRNKGAIQVKDAAELERVLADLLADEGQRNELGANAFKTVQENTGAVERTVELITRELTAGRPV